MRVKLALTQAHMRKAPRGDEAPWRRPPRGRKEAPWDIIGGMTDDRIAYQLAQGPTGSCASLWITPPVDAARVEAARPNGGFSFGEHTRHCMSSAFELVGKLNYRFGGELQFDRGCDR